MGRVFTYTTRESMSPEQVKKGLEAFRNPSKWPDWNSTAKNLLATQPESIDEGDHLAIFQVIKGSLIETKWLVKSIREGDDFCEIELFGEGQSRNERPIAKGVNNLLVTITFLHQENGGIEVHASYEVSLLLSIFSKQINAIGSDKDVLMAFTTSGNSENIMEAIDAVGRNDIGVVYDVANAPFAGEDPCEGVKIVKDRLKLVHLSDTHKNTWRHDPIGMGDIAFADFKTVLDELGFEGISMIEIITEDPDLHYVQGHKKLVEMGWNSF